MRSSTSNVEGRCVMSNGDPILNCVLEVCCDASSEAQYEALAQMLTHDLGPAPHKPEAVATWVLQHFDLAPKGSLSALKREVARLARL